MVGDLIRRPMEIADPGASEIPKEKYSKREP